MVRSEPLTSVKRNTSVESLICHLKNGLHPFFHPFSANCRSRNIPEESAVFSPQGKANVNQATWLHISYLAACLCCVLPSKIRWFPRAGSTSRTFSRSWIYMTIGGILFKNRLCTFDIISCRRFFNSLTIREITTAMLFDYF